MHLDIVPVDRKTHLDIIPVVPQIHQDIIPVVQRTHLDITCCPTDTPGYHICVPQTHLDIIPVVAWTHQDIIPVVPQIHLDIIPVVPQIHQDITSAFHRHTWILYLLSHGHTWLIPVMSRTHLDISQAQRSQCHYEHVAISMIFSEEIITSHNILSVRPCFRQTQDHKVTKGSGLVNYCVRCKRLHWSIARRRRNCLH